MKMKGKPRCKFTTGEPGDGKAVSAEKGPPNLPAWRYPKIQVAKLSPRKRKKPRKSKGEGKEAVVHPTCPTCGKVIQQLHMQSHERRCIASKPPTTTVTQTAYRPLGKRRPDNSVQVSVKRVLSPQDSAAQASAREALELDQNHRNWLQTELKDYLRRLTQLPVENGVDLDELYRVYEGRRFIAERLVRQFFDSHSLGHVGRVSKEALGLFAEYLRDCCRGRELERIPLRDGISILPPEQRAVLAKSISP